MLVLATVSTLLTVEAGVDVTVVVANDVSAIGAATVSLFVARAVAVAAPSFE